MSEADEALLREEVAAVYELQRVQWLMKLRSMFPDATEELRARGAADMARSFVFAHRMERYLTPSTKSLN